MTLLSFAGTIDFPIRELGDRVGSEQIIQALKAERLRIDRAIPRLAAEEVSGLCVARRVDAADRGV